MQNNGKTGSRPEKLSGRISIEKIAHFRCGKCNKWWSIADAPKRNAWFCPWCGTKQKVKTGN